MSATPRTDAVEKNFGEMPGLMRTLELELASALEREKRLREALADIAHYLDVPRGLHAAYAMKSLALDALYPSPADR